MFLDKVRIRFVAGKGGNGVVAWRREKYIPKGGPYGGNGGNGGNIILEVDENISSLDHLRNRRLIKADKGQDGGSYRKKGRKGKDLIIKIPRGTLLKDPETNKIMFDFTQASQKHLLCKGGYGGLGNACFATANNRAPNYCTFGKKGQEAVYILELKMIADVGLVGFPNAGKSTLVSQITHTHIKSAPYPFTTLKPHLGYLRDFQHHQDILFADIPGIIEGASSNRGLGLEFLRHIERTQVLIYLLDASGIDGRTPYEDFIVLQKEVEAYKKQMITKPFLVVLNKIDSPESSELIQDFENKAQIDFLTISALEKEGFEVLIERIHELLKVKKTCITLNGSVAEK